tara:strand:+ start:2862 stop:3167 length:306 start_codon:yes stop_codon:yes gene_type:complete
MDTELNKQVTKLKVQAQNAGIHLKFDTKDNLVMIYPRHRDDVCGSIGYVNENKNFLISYVINLKRMEWAVTEGFSQEQIQKEKKLNILKEVRPSVLVSYLV